MSHHWTWHHLPSPHKTHGKRATVIFVHQFGGNRMTLNRSIQLVHKLGYDAVWFPLLYNKVEFHVTPPLTADHIGGFGRVWTNQVARVLKSVDGPKILYTHSMPSNSAMVALSENPQNIHAWICDGGPFLNIFECVNKLFRHHFKMHRPAAFALTAASMLWYGPTFQRKLPTHLAKLPEGLPVLSLRGEKDILVSPEAIDLFFRHAPQIALSCKSFPEGGHLDLLKRFEAEYEETVSSFLDSVWLK
ncbi:MAG: alpha/beta hydrolase [Bdellovibrionales bacterium]|nr:alpha/beta hydrolase [Bdellovibrionales bacterium]